PTTTERTFERDCCEVRFGVPATGMHDKIITRILTMTTTLRLPALEIQQGPNRVLYSFAVDGKQLSTFATISRIHRHSNEQLGGYQRPEVISHIAEIRRYLESPDPMIPNAVVVAFDERVMFEPIEQVSAAPSYIRPGAIIIP